MHSSIDSCLRSSSLSFWMVWLTDFRLDQPAPTITYDSSSGYMYLYIYPVYTHPFPTEPRLIHMGRLEQGVDKNMQGESVKSQQWIGCFILRANDSPRESPPTSRAWRMNGEEGVPYGKRKERTNQNFQPFY